MADLIAAFHVRWSDIGGLRRGLWRTGRQLDIWRIEFWYFG